MLLKSTKGEIEVYLCPDPAEIPSPSKHPSSPEDYADMVSELSSPQGNFWHPKVRDLGLKIGMEIFLRRLHIALRN